MTPRHLLLVRHAQAAWETPAQGDFSRPLTAAGRRDVEELATWLLEHAACPDAIVASPAARALATAELLAAAWPSAPTVHIEPSLFDAPLDAPARLVSDFTDAWRRVLIVGHNPSLSHSADWFLGEPTVLELPPGGLAWLTLDTPNWHEATAACARLHALHCPNRFFHGLPATSIASPSLAMSESAAARIPGQRRR